MDFKAVTFTPKTRGGVPVLLKLYAKAVAFKNNQKGVSELVAAIALVVIVAAVAAAVAPVAKQMVTDLLNNANGVISRIK